jgi:SAM-dependent methyltransferase
MGVKESRWKQAQGYERGYWRSRAEGAGQSRNALGWYSWRSGQLVELLRRAGREDLTTGGSRVLEIGSGPGGLITYFSARHRTAVDPLASFFGDLSELTTARREEVSYVAATAERLPVESHAFDLVVMENCIDHVRDVDAAMSEAIRSLNGDGLLYFTVNCRTWLGAAVHRALSVLGIDAGHPHTFWRTKVHRLLDKHSLKARSLSGSSYLRALREDLFSGSLRPTTKALLGVSEFLVTVIAEEDLSSTR